MHSIMTSVAPETPRKIIKTRRPNAGVAVRPDKADDTYRTLNRHGDVEDYFGTIDTRRKGISLHTHGPPEDSTREAIEQKSSFPGFKSGRLPVIAPEITLLPSPSRSASTVSSPGSDRGVWDSPDTPSLRPTEQLGIGSITPLTPPTAYELYPDDTPSRKPSGSFSVSNVKGEDIFDQIASRLPDQYDEGSVIQSVNQNEESFQPQKLFRGLTDQFRAISESHAEATARLNLQRSYTFTFDANTPVSSRTRSNIKLEADLENKDVKATIKAETDVLEVKSELSLQIRTPAKGLQGDLEQIIPPEINTRLKEDPGQCVASLVTRTPGRRCSKQSAKGKPTTFAKLMENISTCSREKDYTALFEHVDKLIDAVTCTTHHQKSARARISKVMALKHKFHTGSDELSIFNIWVKSISTPELRLEVKKDRKNTLQAEVKSVKDTFLVTQSTLTPLSTTSATEPVVTVKLPTSRRLAPYQAAWSKGLSPFEAVWSKIKEPLTASDNKYGYIYIFWDKENFGMVKIGHTVDLNERLKQWTRQCKRPYTYHKPSDGGEVVRIPHVSRVERLIHLELKDCRKRHSCEGCGKKHGEWFEVNEPQAVRVVRKWQQWILQRPYAIDSASGEWRIRPEMTHALAQVCKPVLEDVVQVKVGPKKDGKRRKSKRLSSLPRK